MAKSSCQACGAETKPEDLKAWNYQGGIAKLCEECFTCNTDPAAARARALKQGAR